MAASAIGAHGSAESAGDAIRLVCRLYGVVTLFVDLVGCKAQHLFGTYVHAKSATLAVIGFKRKFCHFVTSFQLILGCNFIGYKPFILPFKAS